MTITETREPRYRPLYVNQVCERLGRSPHAVRHLIQSGQLKSGLLGGRRVVRESDLNDFIDSAFSEAD